MGMAKAKVTMAALTRVNILKIEKSVGLKAGKLMCLRGLGIENLGHGGSTFIPGPVVLDSYSRRRSRQRPRGLLAINLPDLDSDMPAVWSKNAFRGTGPHRLSRKASVKLYLTTREVYG
jgi:hypothetical protein